MTFLLPDDADILIEKIKNPQSWFGVRKLRHFMDNPWPSRDGYLPRDRKEHAVHVLDFIVYNTPTSQLSSAVE